MLYTPTPDLLTILSAPWCLANDCHIFAQPIHLIQIFSPQLIAFSRTAPEHFYTATAPLSSPAHPSSISRDFHTKFRRPEAGVLSNMFTEAETPPKHRKVDEDFIRDADLWMDDGKIVIAATNNSKRTQEKQTYAFRCHRSILAKQSKVFEGLLGIPPSAESQDMYDGLPLVVLPDAYADVKTALRYCTSLSKFYDVFQLVIYFIVIVDRGWGLVAYRTSPSRHRLSSNLLVPGPRHVTPRVQRSCVALRTSLLVRSFDSLVSLESSFFHLTSTVTVNPTGFAPNLGRLVQYSKLQSVRTYLTQVPKAHVKPRHNVSTCHVPRTRSQCCVAAHPPSPSHAS